MVKSRDKEGERRCKGDHGLCVGEPFFEGHDHVYVCFYDNDRCGGSSSALGDLVPPLSTPPSPPPVYASIPFFGDMQQQLPREPDVSDEPPFLLSVVLCTSHHNLLRCPQVQNSNPDGMRCTPLTTQYHAFLVSSAP